MVDRSVVVESDCGVALEERELGPCAGVAGRGLAVRTSRQCRVLAGQSAKADLDPRGESLLTGVELAYDDFKVVEVVDLSGAVLASSQTESIDPTGADWFRTLSSGQPVLTSPTQ